MKRIDHKLPYHVYVIGLESNFRGDFLLQQLDKLNVKYTKVDGIDGNGLSTREVSQKYSKEMSTLLFGRELTKGEIGCALSHQSVYQRIGIQEEPYALVLEDDVTLIDGAKILKVLNQITEMVNFRKKPVCVQFGFQENSERNAVGSQITFQKLAKPHFGNYMYFLNKTAAKILEISKDQKIVTCADWPVAANRIDWWKINAPLINLRIDDSILNFERKGEVTKYDNWRKHNSRKQRINKFKHILYKFYTDPQFSSYSKSDLVGYLIPSKLYLMRRRSKFSIRV